MLSSSPHSKSSKFTRGEKCIFAHVVITFAGIVALVVVYYGHACLVRHRGDRVLALGRALPPPASATGPGPGPDPDRSSDPGTGPAYRCVGLALVRDSGRIEERAACGTVALHASWTLAPARCVAARASPHLAHLLPHWRLRYDDLRTGVRRGAAHPHYEGGGDEGAVADLGLFEHERALPLFCAVPKAMRNEILTFDSADLLVVGWLADGVRAAAAARALPAARCAALAAPVAPPPALCLAPLPGSESHLPRHSIGAVVFEGSQLVGISSWGSGKDSLPFIVVIDIAPYQHWIETTMKLF